MIVIIDYGMGNLASVYNAFIKVGINDIKVSANVSDVLNADGVILPGVGAFGDAVNNLNQAKLVNPIIQQVKRGVPFLGICLGYQLLFEESYENGVHKGLGLIKGHIKRFDIDLPVPHMGWNLVEIKKQEKLYAEFDANEKIYFYFDHAYYPVDAEPNSVSSITEYQTIFPSSIMQDNILGVQFHPEKSHHNGLKIIKAFSNLVENLKKE